MPARILSCVASSARRISSSLRDHRLNAAPAGSRRRRRGRPAAHRLTASPRRHTRSESRSCPGPLRTHELGVIPRANTGRPTGTMPSLSRAMPSMTMAATPLFLAIIGDVVADDRGRGECASQATTMTSPGSAITSAARIARLSLAPVSQVSAGPTNCARSGSTGLTRWSSAPRPCRASTIWPVCAPFELGDQFAAAGAGTCGGRSGAAGP